MKCEYIVIRGVLLKRTVFEWLNDVGMLLRRRKK